tara:strand:- start:30 stop:257 length:228 start_codon:yes stop_codon:yes gene_type:complete
MTPEEKAKKLIGEFLPLIKGLTSQEKTNQAIKCSLLCINKQLELINTINNDVADDYYEAILQVKESLKQCYMTPR